MNIEDLLKKAKESAKETQEAFQIKVYEREKEFREAAKRQKPTSETLNRRYTL